MNWFNSPTPLIIGHRGASAHAPENTMKAFHLALEQGAVGFEFDVHRTADGHIVVIHDEELQRTTNGTGRVTHMTLAELEGIDAGDGEPIPTLAQLFATFGNKVLYNVEIKDYSWRNRGTEAAVGRLVSLRSFMGLTSPLFGAFADRQGYRWTMRVGLVFAAVGFLLIGLSQTIWVAILGMISARWSAMVTGSSGGSCRSGGGLQPGFSRGGTGCL
jgi:hypothetical protein